MRWYRLIVYNWNVHMHAQQHITNRLESGDHGQTFLLSSFYKHPSWPQMACMEIVSICHASILRTFIAVVALLKRNRCDAWSAATVG
jgi:hypothetical protein